jgi:hypothetical protein
MRVRFRLGLSLFVVMGGLACGAPPDSPARVPAPSSSNAADASAAPVASASSAPSSSAPAPDAPVTIPKEPAIALLELVGRFNPESLSAIGLPGHEDDIVDLDADVDARSDRALAAVIAALADEEARESEPERKLDVQLVLRAAKLQREETALERATFIPYKQAARIVYHGLKALLASPGGEAHALARLTKYAGDDRTTSVFERVEARTLARVSDEKLLYPTKGEVDDELKNLPAFFDDLATLWAKQTAVPKAQWEPAFLRLRQKADAHVAFIKTRIAPRARADFRLPLPFYDFLLKQNGVTIPRAALESRARAAYAATKKEMADIAPKVAKARGLKTTDPSAILLALKKDQREGDALLALYKERLATVEGILKKKNLVTLPAEPVRVRLATAGETADNPSPTIDVSALFKPDAPIDFLLPVGGLEKPGEKTGSHAYTDFTYDAAAWVLCAHEGRPGHELQFTAIKKKGLSLSRTLFAFNSTNVEGWALYAEHVVYPSLPPEGQLVALRMRALREARAFLDPGLHEGTVTMEQATQVLQGELGFGDGVTKMELDRYTFQSPTQATAYFFGYQSLLSLREEAERQQGKKFDTKQFHDAVLGAGLLPPDLQRAAVLKKLASQ